MSCKPETSLHGYEDDRIFDPNESIFIVRNSHGHAVNKSKGSSNDQKTSYWILLNIKHQEGCVCIEHYTPR